MTKLSVNINKVATLRNSRGGNNPDVIKVAIDCEHFGAQGITVHPRPDERHIKYRDVIALKEVITTEFNIEGFPDERYMELVKKVRPTQATLVPDPPGAITSNAGWDTIENKDFLRKIVEQLKNWGIRTSVFVDPVEKFVQGAVAIGTDRIELYTEPFAIGYLQNKDQAVTPYAVCSALATREGIGVNAGHDLDLNNLRYLKQNLPGLLEVSIGHALISDALYYGLENTIQMYLRQLE